MQLKVKRKRTLWRNEGLFLYHHGISMYFIYGGPALLPYYLQQVYFFETLMNYMVFQYVIFACLM